jgi:hypothetical protein
MVFETNISNDKGLITVDIPACHFLSKAGHGPAFIKNNNPKD